MPRHFLRMFKRAAIDKYAMPVAQMPAATARRRIMRHASDWFMGAARAVEGPGHPDAALDSIPTRLAFTADPRKMRGWRFEEPERQCTRVPEPRR
jgi:hypothetical protein